MKKNYKIAFLTLIAVLLVWELSVRVFHISLYILPAPSMIVSAMISQASVLWKHSLVTLYEALAGLMIATILAVMIAIAMDRFQSFKVGIYPYLIVTQTVPIMVLGPLFSLWLGFGLAPKILIVIFMCFFPIAIGFEDALSQADQKQINLLRSFKASTVQIYRMVKIPSGALGLFSGLKIASSYCIGGAIVGEWLSSSAGLGYYMLRVKNGYMLDRVFASVIVVILWSVLLNKLVNVIEYFVFPHLRRGEKK